MDYINGTTNDFFIGLPGSGKTLMAVYDYVLPHLLAGEQVWSDTWLNWSGDNLHYFSADDFRSLSTKLRNCLIFFDEVQRILEPRDWDSEDGNIRAFFQLHRHRHLSIVGTTQDISLVAKSALITVDNFIYTEKTQSSFLSRLLFGKHIPVSYQVLSLRELKSVLNFFDIGQDTGDNLVNSFQRRSFRFNKHLVRSDLNSFKSELYHFYCPVCASRQNVINGSFLTELDLNDKPYKVWSGSPIPKDWSIGKIQEKKYYCPRHKDIVLDIRPSLMYDTEYELILTPPNLIWKPYFKEKAERVVPYKGTFSSSPSSDSTPVPPSPPSL